MQETSISVRLEQFESDGVMTILEWTQENSLYSYYVTVTPDMELWINGSASINLKLKVPYNTSHNVSVVAMPPCTKDTVEVTRFIELFYCKLLTISYNILIFPVSILSIRLLWKSR